MNFMVVTLLSLILQISGIKVVPMYIRQSWLKTTSSHITECACKTKIDPILCTRVFLETAFSSDTRLQCYLKCISEKLNFLDDRTGKWSEREIARQMEGVTTEIAKRCINLTKNINDLSRNAFEMFLCMSHSVSKSENEKMKKKRDEAEDERRWIENYLKQHHYENHDEYSQCTCK